MNAAFYLDIGEFVEQKGWSAYDVCYGDDGFISNAIISLFDLLDGDEEKRLVSEILNEYIIIKDYFRKAKEMLEHFVVQANGAPIAICPVKDFSAQKIKSADALVYDMNSLNDQKFNGMFSFFDDPRSSKFQEFSGYKVIVDDYIGSGSQFNTMIDEMVQEGHPTNFDLVAAIIAQQDGIQRINGLGYAAYATDVRGKCLDSLRCHQLKGVCDVYAVYDGIEGRMGVSPEYTRGYGQSEAAVTLKKTPNNTLPIFWMTKGTKWPAPFPRPKS